MEFGGCQLYNCMLFLTYNYLVVKFILRSKILQDILVQVDRKYKFIWKIEEGVLGGSDFNRGVCNREKFIEFKEEF